MKLAFWSTVSRCRLRIIWCNRIFKRIQMKGIKLEINFWTKMLPLLWKTILINILRKKFAGSMKDIGNIMTEWFSSTFSWSAFRWELVELLWHLNTKSVNFCFTPGFSWLSWLPLICCYRFCGWFGSTNQWLGMN